eukprot:4234629-Pyramimonas_sp.AAC.1
MGPQKRCRPHQSTGMATATLKGLTGMTMPTRTPSRTSRHTAARQIPQTPGRRPALHIRRTTLTVQHPRTDRKSAQIPPTLWTQPPRRADSKAWPPLAQATDRGAP